MRVAHFTVGATDPLQQFSAHGVWFVPLADGGVSDETGAILLLMEAERLEATERPFIQE